MIGFLEFGAYLWINVLVWKCLLLYGYKVDCTLFSWISIVHIFLAGIPWVVWEGSVGLSIYLIEFIPVSVWLSLYISLEWR
jgi:hypothetical protein